MRHRTLLLLPARVLASLVMLGVLACSAGPARAQSACSTTRYICDRTSGESSELIGSYCSSRVSWDMTAGTFHCEAVGCYASTLSGEASLAATALYAITGLPPGTPVVVRLRFTVDAIFTLCHEWGCNADGGDSVRVVGPGAAWSARDFEGTQVIEMQFDGLSGDTFGITFYSEDWAAGNEDPTCGYVTVNGQADFYDVTAGAVVAPCTSNATPARSASWGRLKVMYR